MPVSFTLNRVTELHTDADNDGYADAGDVLRHILTITNTGDTDATSVLLNDLLGGSTETGLMNISPIAFNDAFTAVGNTALRVGGAANIGSGPSSQVVGNLLANDVGSTTVGVGIITGDDVTGFTITAVTNGDSAHGTYNIFADGSFNYIGDAGYTGTDSFTYTITDAGIDGVANTMDDTSSTATVTITIANQVWYVDNSAAAGGDGTSWHPFDSLSDVTGASGPDVAGSIIYVGTGSGSYDGGITLLNNQELHGAGTALTVGGFNLAGAGTDPTIVNTGATNGTHGVVLASGNTLTGFTVGNTGGFDIANTATATVGTLTISNVDLTGTGGLFRADSGGTLSVTFDNAGTTSATGNGIHLGGATSGTFTTTSGAISGVAGTDVLINGGTATISIGSSITSNTGGSIDIGSHATNNVTLSGAINITGGTGISVHNNTSGTIAFTNGSKVVSTGTGNAVDLDTNAGATVNFTGGGLDLDTTTGTAFDATGGGVFSITGSGNSATTTTGTAINLNGMSVGVSGATFATVNTNGAANGIMIAGLGQSAGSTGLDINGGAIVNASTRGVDIDSSSADIHVAATISTTAAGRSVEVTNSGSVVAGGNLIDFAGAIDENGLGINLDNNDQNTNGATINFTGGLDIDSTVNTGFNAVNGGTINVTGTNTIDTTTGTALNVANTTIGASDLTFQSISAGTGAGSAGVGISLVSTGAVGGLHVTGTGAAGSGGTIQNKTGADGTNTGIGIYINGATDVQLADMTLHDFSNFAVRINNVTNLRMNNFAVTGLNGSSNGVVDATAAGAQNGEDSVRLTNILGTSSVTNSSISGGFTDSLHVENTSGTLNLLTLDNISVTGRNNASANDALNILATNAGTIMNIAVLNSDFTTGMNKMVNVGAKAGTTINILYDNNTVVQSATLANIVPGGGGVSFNGLGNMNFSILNSSFDFSNGGAGIKSIGLNIFKGGGSTGNFTGVVFNNSVGVSGVNDSGSGPAASALNVDSQGTGSFTLLLRNNSVFHYDEAGIRLNDVDGSSTFNAVVVGNTVSQPEPTAFSGLYVVAGADPGTDGSQITNLQLGGGAGFTNNFSAGDPANAADVFLQNSAGQLRLSQGNSSSGSVPTVFANNNPAAGTTFVTTDPGPPAIIVETADFVRLIVSPSTVTEDGVTNITYTFLRWGNTQNALTVNFTVGGTATFNTDYTQSGAATFTASTGTVTFAAGSPVATITINPTTDAGVETNETVVLTLAAGGGYTAATPNSGTATILDDDTAPLLAGSTPPADGGDKGTGDGTGGDQPGPAPVDPTPPSGQPIVVDDGVLSQAELNLIVSAAIDRWAAAGVSAADIAAMRAVTFDVADMAGLTLGSSTAGHIILDSNAAGFSWFIDATPGEDSEYNGSGTRLTAAPDSQAGVRIDLLTTIMHELGHQIGLVDSYAAGDNDDLMYGLINPGERRLPGADDVQDATGAPVSSLAFALSPVNLGTIPAGRVVTVQWDSTVNAFTNQIVPTFNNTSSVSGGNFVTTNSNTNVLAPTGVPSSTNVVLDSLTLGNLVFLDANNNGMFDGGDTGINGVALTLFADTNANGVFDAGDVQLATTTTLGGGLYSFANLAPGDYIVRVDASNFTGGGALLNRVTAIGGADPDDNADNDDNGVSAAGGIVVTQAITLTQNGETTLDASNKLDINNTLDLGFVELNDPPVNTVPGTQTINEGATATFTGGTAISVNDTDVGAGNLTVTLSVNHGVLTLSGTAGLSFGPGDGTNDATMTFTGTQAAVNAALNGLVYTPNADFNGSDTLTITTNDNGNTGSDPGTSGGPADEQDSDTVTINITAINDAPTVVNGTTETSTTINEDTPLALGQSVTTLFGGHYSDAADNQVPNGGASSPGAFSGVAVTANGSSGATGQWQYSTNGGGSWQDIGAVTDATARVYNPGTLIRFNPALDYNGPEPTLTVHLIDNSGPAIVDNALANLTTVGGTTPYSAGTVALGGTVTAINDAPVNTVPGTQTIDEDGTVTFSTGNGNAISVNDVDVGGGDLRVTIGMLNGQLTLSGTAGLTFSVGDGLDDTTMTFTGTQAAINAALQGLLYEATLNNNGSDTLTFTVNDQGNSGTDPGNSGDGNSEQDSDTVLININAVNDTPVLTVATPLASTEQVFQTIDAAASVSDIDLDALNGGDGDYGGATLTVVRQGGANPDDLFQFAASGSFTVNGSNLEAAGNLVFASFTNSGGTLTISFNDSATTATTTLVNAVLDAIQYANNNDSPPASIDLDVSLDDGAPANAGQGSVAGHPAADTATVHVNITGTPEDIAPVLDLDGGGGSIDNSAVYTENDGPVTLASGNTITDPDDTDLEGATVQVTTGFQSGLDYLTVNGGTNGTISGITFNYVAATGILTLTGTATLATYQSVLAQVGFESTSNSPGTSRTISWTVNDGSLNSSPAALTTVTITEVNDEPTLTATGTDPTYTENGAAADLFSGVTVTTPEAGQALTSLTLTVTNVTDGADEILFFDGSDVALTNGNMVTSATNGLTVNVTVSSGTATVTFSGASLTPAQVQTLVDGLTYRNAGENPTDADRVVTITELVDNGSNASPNDNIATLSVSSTVDVAPVNDAALITGDIAGDVTEAGGVNNGTPGTPTASGDLDSTDVDNADDVWQAVAAGGTTANGYGSYQLAADGGWTYTLNDNNAAVQALTGAATLTDTFDALTGDGTAQTVTITIHAQDDAAVANPDAVTTDEASVLAGNVFSNNGSGADSDPDGPAFTVTAVNGVGASVGTQITLGSGAHLTLNANGTFSYDPNHVFDATPTGGSGASNTPAHDSFTYTLSGGGTAMVSVTITGLDSNDLLLSTAGSANLSGGTGNDTYVIDDAGDRIFELSGQGSDIAYALVDHQLEPGSEVERLSAIDWTFTTPLSLTGNELVNLIEGNAGANVLNGGAGADRMLGFGGNDLYVVDNAGDQVVETAGQGSDTVYALADYQLGFGSEIERLSAIDWTFTNALSLTGNELANLIEGNAGANTLNGGAGVDVMVGFGGNDVYVVDNAGDQVIEAAGQGSDIVYALADYTLAAGSDIERLSAIDWTLTNALNLTGNALANLIEGNAGVNVLNGGDGSDTLVGFGGADTFAFTTALGAGNVDTILDFVHGTDKLALENAIFDQLVPGALGASLFHAGAAATDEDQRIIYDQATGNLYYDADGNGAQAAVLFATLQSHPVLTASDFIVT